MEFFKWTNLILGEWTRRDNIKYMKENEWHLKDMNKNELYLKYTNDNGWCCNIHIFDNFNEIYDKQWMGSLVHLS